MLQPDAGPTAVPLVALMLRLILKNENDTGKVNCLVSGLRKVIEVKICIASDYCDDSKRVSSQEIFLC